MSTLAFGHTKFDRASIPDNLRDLSTWPTVDETALSDSDRANFNARREAIRIFVEEQFVSLALIKARTGVDPRTLYRLLERCWSRHVDGRIYGFRGAIPYARLKDYERNQPISATAASTSGLSGAFSQLLQKYPSLKKLLQQAASDRNRKIDGPREVRKSLRRIHKAFLAECREVGIQANEYPFTQSLLGIRSLATYLKKLSEGSIVSAARNAGALKIGPAAPETDESGPAATRAFEAVEFDGHKIDLRITVRVKDPFGMETVLELNRIWILVLLDIVTRAVIGYALALGKEYNKDDVAAALQNALIPYRPRQFKMPGLAIRKEGGFPSGILPAAEYAGWDWFRFDGARSHVAADTLERLTKIVGCWPDNGPAGEPDQRPFIERFFQLIAQHFAHRLPGTTGSDPKAIEKLLSDPGANLSLLVELGELEEMIEVLLADYNGEPHDGIGGRTPLEAMTYHVSRQRGFIRTLPSLMRSNLCLLQEARTVPIRGKLSTGVRPHVNFAGVRYTSDILSQNAALFGKTLRIYFDVRDIRVVKAFFEDGSELGILTAARPWCYTPHSLRVRQEILRLKREGKLKYREGDDPVEAWVKYKRAQAKTSKRAAGDLAKHNVQQPMQALSLPVPLPPQIDNPSLPVEQKNESAPQPRTMRLKRTLTF